MWLPIPSLPSPDVLTQEWEERPGDEVHSVGALGQRRVGKDALLQHGLSQTLVHVRLQVHEQACKDSVLSILFPCTEVGAHCTFFKIYAVEIGHQFRARGIIRIVQDYISSEYEQGPTSSFGEKSKKPLFYYKKCS